MTVVPVELGSRRLTVCPRCKSGTAWVRDLLVLTDEGIQTEPVKLIGCPDCGYLIKEQDDTCAHL